MHVAHSASAQVRSALNGTIAGASGSTFALASKPGNDSTTSLSFSSVGDFQTLNLGLASGENSIGQNYPIISPRLPR